MKQYLFENENVSYTYDFSELAVRVTITEGNASKCSIANIFDIAYCLDYMSSDFELLSYDKCPYAELRRMLLKRLEEKQYANVKIIK